MSYSSNLLSLPGATPLHSEPLGLDASGVAWHYGNPLAEQRQAHDTGAVVDRSQRVVLKVTGSDAASFLNNITSQKLDDAPIGFSASLLDLDIQGHVLHHGDVTRTAEGFYIDLPSAQADSFEQFLHRMIFWSEVTVERTDLGILTVLGGQDLPEIDAAYVREVDWSAIRRRDIAVKRSLLIDATTTLGLPPAGLMAFSAERVRAVEPEIGVDFDAKAIAHEAPTLIGRGEHAGAVHLNKGCYRGQETVARVENLGRSPRLLVTVHLDGSHPTDPQPGEAIKAGARAVGRLGTVVHDYDYGPIGLALIKRSALAAPALETASGVALSVDRDSLPTDEGAKAGRAAVDKLRGRG